MSEHENVPEMRDRGDGVDDVKLDQVTLAIAPPPAAAHVAVHPLTRRPNG